MAYRRTSYARRAARTYTVGRARRRSRRTLLRPRRTYVRGRGSYRVTAPKSQARGRAFGRSVGESVGSLIGSRFGPGLGGLASAGLGYLGDKIGAFAGNKIGTALGWGGYKISKNTVYEGTAVPYMHKSGQTAHIAHREFLGDVVSGPTANTFNVDYFNINPANKKIAPWLSNLASQYQEYKIKGMMFHFVSTTASALVAGSAVDGSSNNIGTVVMATSYNSGIPNPFPNKSAMENTQYTQSAKLSCELVEHPIECDPRLMPYNLWYIRTGPVPTGQPIQMYDYAKFAIATISPYANSTLGELWVTYDIELVKPILRNGVNVLTDVFKCDGPFTDVTAFNLIGDGVVEYNNQNSIGGRFYGVTVSPTNGATIYEFGPNVTGLTFQVTMSLVFENVSDLPPNVSEVLVPQFIGCTPQNNVLADNNWFFFAPAGGANQGLCVSNNVLCSFVVTITEPEAFINFTATGLVVNSGCEYLNLVVTQIDSDVANGGSAPGFRAADSVSVVPGDGKYWDAYAANPQNYQFPKASSKFVAGAQDPLTSTGN